MQSSQGKRKVFGKKAKEKTPEKPKEDPPAAKSEPKPVKENPAAIMAALANDDSEDEEPVVKLRRKSIKSPPKKEETKKEDPKKEKKQIQPKLMDFVNKQEEKKKMEDLEPIPPEPTLEQEEPKEILQIHDPLVPGFTTADSEGRQYLTWTHMGAVMCRESASQFNYEVDFRDKSKYPSIIFKSHNQFYAASIGTSGVAFGSQYVSDQQPGIVHFRAFSALSTKSWNIALPAKESVVCMGVCDDIIVVATDANLLRIFTLGGSQLVPICLPASPVTLTARNRVFALVYNNALGCGLSCRIYNTSEKKLLVETQVCISELSELKWIGLSDKGTLVTMDTLDRVRGLFYDWGWSWVPLLEGKDVDPDNILWPVFVDHKTMQLFAARLIDLRTQPDCVDRPRLEPFKLQLPVCDQANDTDKSMTNHCETILREDLFNRFSGGLVIEPKREDNIKFNKQQNKRKLKFFQELCSKGLLDQALEIFQTVQNTAIIKKAIKVADFYNLSELKRRIERIISKREKEEAMRELSETSAPKSTPSFAKGKIENVSKAPEFQTPNTTSSSAKPTPTSFKPGSKRPNPFASSSSASKKSKPSIFSA